MTTARDILKAKGFSEVYSVSPEDSVYSALDLMNQKNVGAVLVIENGQPAGILSERDYARKITLAGKSSKDTKVREIMTQQLLGANVDDTAEECLALITAKRIRHLPVFEGDRMVGLISSGDVVKSIISEQQILIQHQRDYITGKYL